MAKVGFDDVVAARTRAAIQMLETADMLEAYLVAGGKQTDLTAIRDHGTRAEALNLAQTAAQASGGAATLTLLQELAWVQREYVTIMAALRSERVDLVEAGATPEVLERVDAILKDETQVSVRTTTFADGSTQKKRQASKAQEATRAEIERDANALIELTEIHAGLGQRRIDLARLTQLRDRARALSGKLAKRSEKKGAAKGVTKSERDAVKLQTTRWGASYGTLSIAAATHAGIAQLLKDARE